MAELIWEIEGESLTFLPEKAIYWPRRRSLMVADLHWGKAETFQMAGIPVSSELLADDLGRLGTLLRRYPVEQVLILGDLLHGRSALTPALRHAVWEWRKGFSAAFILMAGNHDQRSPPLPREWDFEVCPDLRREEPFVLSHHPPQIPQAYTWCGHLHPMFRSQRRGDSLRLPCFHLRPRYGVLPSFGSFTGGMNVTWDAADTVLVIADGEVLALR